VLAWGPATHVALGEMVLGSLYLVPPAVSAVLERYPLHFLYGSIAADISFAKKYVPEGRHCHNWEVGEEILDTADSGPLRAVGFGYLAHLAADTVAHNLYVPRRLLLTSTTEAMGHTYWEHRMDAHIGDAYMERARRVVTGHDHSEADALFDTVLSRTIFSFRTNRRIFRGMIRFQGDERWRRVFEKVLQNSRFDLPEPLVERYRALSYDYVMDYLIHRAEARPATLDPVGELNLRLAKKLRRIAIADRSSRDEEALDEMAEDFFPLPEESLVHFPEYQREERAVDAGREEEAPSTGELPEPGISPALEGPFEDEG